MKKIQKFVYVLFFLYLCGLIWNKCIIAYEKDVINYHDPIAGGNIWVCSG